MSATNFDTVVLPPTRSDAPDDDDTERDGASPAPDAAPLAVGDRVGPYEIESLLAKGGFGVVYRARGPGGAAAVKVLRPDLATTEQTLARFEREVDAVARVEHPHVVRVLGRGRMGDGRPYFAMELLDGCDLAAHIRTRGALPWTDALALLSPICDALAAAHERGIVHRDIKASNVFLAGERVVLLDFGVAKVLDPEVPGLTRSRQIVGTPACMAPEQLGGGPIDSRTDVYALGALAYHMLTGKPPFAAESPVMLRHLHRHARRPRPSAAVALPSALDQAVVTAMAVDPQARPPDARALWALFEGAAEAGKARKTRRCRAMAVHVDVAPACAGAASGEVFDALERGLAEAERRLEAAGLRPALAASRALVYARTVSDDAAAAREAENLIRELHAGSSDLVRVAAEAIIGDALAAGDVVITGEALALSRAGQGAH